MLKLTRAKAMNIVTLKAFGFFVNISFGRTAKAKAKTRFIWTHSYEQNCLASDYAQLFMTGIYGRRDWNAEPALLKEYILARESYLARMPKLTRVFVAA